MKRATRPILITDARPTPEQQIRRREARYLGMMAARVACLLVAGILVSAGAPLLWLWVPLCLVGMVVLPWLAVLIANDAPPKSRRASPARGGGAPDGQRSELARAIPGPGTAESHPKIIDVEP